MSQRWSDEAKRAILTVVATLGYLKRPGMSMQGLRAELESELLQLHINPDIIS
jgi:hypothetical protein